MGFSIGCVVYRFFYDFIKGFGVERMSEEKKNPEDPKGKPQDPVSGIFDAGTDIMNKLEIFGIEKKDVGKAILKSVVSGKIDLGILGERGERKSKFEKLANGIQTIIWTVVGAIVLLMSYWAVLTYFLGKGV